MSIQTPFVHAVQTLCCGERNAIGNCFSQLMLLQYVEVAKVFDLLCHPVSSIKLKPDPIIPEQRHQGICKSKNALPILGCTTKANESKNQEAQGKSWARIQERLGQKLQFSCSVEIGLSNIIVLRTIVFIIFGTEKPWAQTLVI